MWIIVGLGNPGAAYAHSRHNIGFMVVETLALRWGIVWDAADGALRIGRGSVGGRPIVLAEPQAFMNRSGEALAGLPLEADDALVVVHDDVDLPAGRLRLRARGGSAGHRGVASLAERFGSEFARLRVGIGRPPEGQEVAEYVLVPLSRSESDSIRAGVERAADAMECIVTDGLEAAMNRFNAPAPDSDDAAKEN
jgi:PTH1 family peptidyl-tRNA hydrolase